ncbi:MAG: adenine phosphoribosyltransferase [Campylobacterales bacterium]|nr:adenine phosphoribosyltransferase [Campylobacterales bacterium]
MKELEKKELDFLLNSIRDIKDFPKQGIVFKDITTLLNNKEAFGLLMNHLHDRYKDSKIDFVAGIESRGFIFGSALATKLNVGFVPIRKKGKLPFTTIGAKYSLEYGVDEIEIHTDAFRDIEHANVLLIDDLIATGGTANAAVNLIKTAKANCVDACFLIELRFLEGVKELLKHTSVYSVLKI